MIHFNRCLAFMLLVLLGAVSWSQAAKTIQALDKLAMTCVEESLLSKTYKVTKDGVILVDFLGAVEVQGLTEAEASAKVSQKLISDRILKVATVTVAIQNEETTPGTVVPVEPNVIKIAGHVKAPADVSYKDGLKLSDILKPSDVAADGDISRVTVKSLDGKETVVDSSKPENDIVLKPGDLVSVPELKKESKIRNEVYVMGGVSKPGAIALSAPMTARSAIQAAGGFSSMATEKKVRVEREGQSAKILDLTVAANDEPLLPNDRVIVEVSESRGYVQVGGAVRNPGYCVAKAGMRLSEAIEASGGMLSNAKTTRVKVVPSSGGKGKDVNYDEILQGFSGDVVLQPGDQVFVPGQKKKDMTPLRLAAGAAAVWLIFGR